jgi:hypothetical protein
VTVAKSVEVMARETPIELTFKLDGPDTLWLIEKKLQTKLTRLE